MSLTWASSGTDEPLDQTADSARFAGWFAIGPERPGVFSLTLCAIINQELDETPLGDFAGEENVKRAAQIYEDGTYGDPRTSP